MADRVLTFHRESGAGAGRMGPAYFIEADYTPTTVRIHSEETPTVGAAEFDIFDDGVSIFDNRASIIKALPSRRGPTTSQGTSTTVVLSEGDSVEEMAEDFNDNVIERGSWVTCELFKSGNGRNYTVLLELRKLTEDDEEDE